MILTPHRLFDFQFESPCVGMRQKASILAWMCTVLIIKTIDITVMMKIGALIVWRKV